MHHSLSNILRLCQVATKDNTAADLQQSHVQNTFPFEATGIPVGSVSVIVLLRCLIDRGSVKSDSLFCSFFGDLPCHVSHVLRSR